jgi:hypothetical protein
MEVWVMLQFWLVSWTPENFEIYKNSAYTLFGIPGNRQSVTKSIFIGDKLIIYTLKEQRIRAICECISGYYYDEKPIWPDGIYPYRFQTRLLVEGDIDYRTLRN